MKLTQEEWIKKAKEIHGNKYDYSKVEYKGSHEKVKIICNNCGKEFIQEARAHINGAGCRECSMKKVWQYNHVSRNKDQGRLTTEEFIKRAKDIHGEKYDYSKVEYKNANTKVCIVCTEHGEFWQTPTQHTHKKHGCPKCNGGIKDTETDFLNKVQKMYGDLYNTEKVKYEKSNKKVCLICNNTDKNGNKHGEFWITPNSLLSGHGCPHCIQTNSEYDVKTALIDENIRFIPQKTFEWLKYTKHLRLDFYLPDYNIAIECQGIQHFKPIDFAGKGENWASEMYEYTKERDIVKEKLCNEHGIKLLQYSEFDVNNKNIITNINDLIKTIKNE